MDNQSLVLENIYKEIQFRYNVEDLEEIERYFCRALQDVEIQEKIYDKVYQIMLDK